jgi:hypothetical protein
MNCALCDGTSYLGLTLLNSKHICFTCVLEIKRYQNYAPNPYQDQPGNYFPKIGATSK